MATAKKAPQDHKGKALDPEDPLAPTSVVEVQALGETWTIAISVLNDYELLRSLKQIQDANKSKAAMTQAALALPDALDRLLGSAQHDRAMSLVRDPITGIVTIDAASNIFSSIFAAMQEQQVPNS